MYLFRIRFTTDSIRQFQCHSEFLANIFCDFHCSNICTQSMQEGAGKKIGHGRRVRTVRFTCELYMLVRVRLRQTRKLQLSYKALSVLWNRKGSLLFLYRKAAKGRSKSPASFRRPIVRTPPLPHSWAVLFHLRAAREAESTHRRMK